MASPVPDRPGLMIRDPLHYSEATLIVPPALVECLQFFDGEQTEGDLRVALVQLTGDLRVSELVGHLRGVLSESGFFHDAAYAGMRERKHADFAQADRRDAIHAGSGYPGEPDELHTTLDRYLDGSRSSLPGLAGIAAPHVSPKGGWQSYGGAYGALGDEYRDRIFIVLGTSHYGEPDRFGLTLKPFVTPFGATIPVPEIVEKLAAEGGPAAKLEDYCHAVEHSIEFQVIFLQHLYGAAIPVVPILCGPFFHCGKGRPAEDEAVGRFLETMRALAAAEGRRLFWVMGVDMAHMGRRYGDLFSARAGSGQMQEVASADRERLEALERGDAEAFWQACGGVRDGLKWCGASPLYTFLTAVPGVRGVTVRYEQWNIDEHSVVSFGALAFSANGSSRM